MQRTIASPQTMVRRMVRVKSTGNLPVCGDASPGGRVYRRLIQAARAVDGGELDVRRRDAAHRSPRHPPDFSTCGLGGFPHFDCRWICLRYCIRPAIRMSSTVARSDRAFEYCRRLKRAAGRRVGRFVSGPVDRPVLFRRRPLKFHLQAGEMVQEGDAHAGGGRSVRLPDGRFRAFVGGGRFGRGRFSSQYANAPTAPKAEIATR